MYDTSGDYGKVRIVDSACSELDKQSLFCYIRTFWHECNDLYGIVRPEGCDNILVIVTLEGSAVLELENKVFKLKPGDVAIIKPYTSHSYYCEKGCNWTFYGIHIENNFASFIVNRIINSNGVCFKHQTPQVLCDILERILIENHISTGTYSFETSALVSNFLHLLSKKEESANAVSKSAGIFEKSVKIIEENYSSDLTVDKISAALFISTPHFIREFKKHAKITPHQYIENYRLLQARHLLSNTNMMINEIAKAVGYKNTSNFIAHFKKSKGITPNEYRKNLDKYEKRNDRDFSYYTKDNKPAIIKYKIY